MSHDASLQKDYNISLDEIFFMMSYDDVGMARGTVCFRVYVLELLLKPAICLCYSVYEIKS